MAEQNREIKDRASQKDLWDRPQNKSFSAPVPCNKVTGDNRANTGNGNGSTAPNNGLPATESLNQDYDANS